MGKNQQSSGLDYVGRVAKGLLDGFRRQLPPSVDREDVLQEAHAILAKELGPDYGARIGQALESPGFEDSPTAKMVKRVLWRAQGRLRMTKKRMAVAKSSVPIGDQIDPPDGAVNAHQLLELTIDLAGEMDRATPEEQRVWELMCEHMKNTEIAKHLSIDHRRVSEIQATIKKRIERVIRE